MITAHHDRAEAPALVAQAAHWLAERGHTAWLPRADADALGLPQLGEDHPAASADLVVSLGGDGTMLRAVQLLDGAEVPIIGVNVGLLGYLAEVEPSGLETALERFFAGDYELDARMMLEVSVEREGRPPGSLGWRALNEAVLEKHESGHTVRLLVHIDGSPFTSYAADGMIVATPTGSTAYSLSARGPVVSPTHRAMLLTPVSPHMLFDRSLVLDPDEDVAIEVMGHRQVDLTVDGQQVAGLGEGDIVRCRPSTTCARFVRFGPRHFHQILKAKFGLSDR
jgi:NAD+ kinase